MRTVPAVLAAALAVTACKKDAAGPVPADTVVIDFSRCVSWLRPIWFAFADGAGGAWARVDGVGDRYTLALTQPRFGYAWVVADPNVFVRFATVAETTENPLLMCRGDKTVFVTVSGLTGGLAYVSLGGGSVATAAEGTPQAMNAVWRGTQDLLAVVTGGSNDGRMILRRDLDVPAGGSVGSLDFAGGESFAPATATLSVANAEGETIISSMTYRTGGDCAPLYVPQPAAVTALRGVPAARQRSTDFHYLTVYAGANASWRFATRSFNVLGDLTVTMGPSLSAPTVTELAGPNLRLRFAVTLPAELRTRLDAGYGNANISATVGYFAGGASVVEMPDLSGVSGWQVAWAPTMGPLLAQWWVQALGVTGAPCAEGSTVFGASRSSLAGLAPPPWLH